MNGWLVSSFWRWSTNKNDTRVSIAKRWVWSDRFQIHMGAGQSNSDQCVISHGIIKCIWIMDNQVQEIECSLTACILSPVVAHWKPTYNHCHHWHSIKSMLLIVLLYGGIQLQKEHNNLSKPWLWSKTHSEPAHSGKSDLLWKIWFLNVGIGKSGRENCTNFCCAW